MYKYKYYRPAAIVVSGPILIGQSRKYKIQIQIEIEYKHKYYRPAAIVVSGSSF